MSDIQKLVEKIYYRYYSNVYWRREDLLQAGWVGYLIAKKKKHTNIYSYIRNYMGAIIRKEVREDNKVKHIYSNSMEPSIDVEDIVEKDDMLANIVREVDNLDKELKDVLVNVFMEEKLTQKEYAKKRKITQSTVSHRIDKALKVLRDKFNVQESDLGKRKTILTRIKCNRCDELKSLSEFEKRKNSKYGVRKTCRVCRYEGDKLTKERKKNA